MAKRLLPVPMLSISLVVLMNLIFWNFSYAAPELISTGYSSVSPTRLPLWVAWEAKLFDQHGLDVKLIRMGPAGPVALIAGEIQIFSGQASPLIAAQLQGATDIVIVAGLGSQDFGLLARHWIRTPQDLKGKKIGVSRFGTFTYYATLRLLRHLGLQPDKDVTIIQTGAARGLERVTMLFAGTIDATLAQKDDVPITKIKFGEDVSVLGSLKETGFYVSGSDLIMKRRFLKENSDSVRRFLLAVVKGIHITMTQKDFALRVLGKYIREDDKRLLEIPYNYFVSEVYQRKPYPDKQSLRVNLQTLEQEFPQAKNKTADDFIDTTILAALDRSGFIDALYK